MLLPEAQEVDGLTVPSVTSQAGKLKCREIKRVTFPGGASGKEPACQRRTIGDAGSVPGSGRSPGGGHGNPLQYSCLKNPMDRGAWRFIVYRVAQSDMTEVI